MVSWLQYQILTNWGTPAAGAAPAYRAAPAAGAAPAAETILET